MTSADPDPVTEPSSASPLDASSEASAPVSGGVRYQTAKGCLVLGALVFAVTAGIVILVVFFGDF